MRSEMSDLVPVPQDLTGTHLPDPDDLNTQRSAPSGLKSASVSEAGLVSVAVMQPNPHVGTGTSQLMSSAWMS